jgi:hypothetical protein
MLSSSVDTKKIFRFSFYNNKWARNSVINGEARNKWRARVTIERTPFGEHDSFDSKTSYLPQNFVPTSHPIHIKKMSCIQILVSHPSSSRKLKYHGSFGFGFPR